MSVTSDTQSVHHQNLEQEFVAKRNELPAIMLFKVEALGRKMEVDCRMWMKLSITCDLTLKPYPILSNTFQFTWGLN